MNMSYNQTSNILLKTVKQEQKQKHGIWQGI